MTNSTRWQSITMDAATAHPFYGVKNWLAVFALGVLMTPLRDLGSINSIAQKVGVSILDLLSDDSPAAAFSRAALVWEMLFSLVILSMLLTKHRLFRPVATSMLLAVWPVVGLIGARFQFEGVGHAIVMEFFQWALFCSVWVPYLQLSKRVRVTFEHLVEVGDAAAHAGNHPHISTPDDRPFPQTTPGPRGRLPAEREYAERAIGQASDRVESTPVGQIAPSLRAPLALPKATGVEAYSKSTVDSQRRIAARLAQAEQVRQTNEGETPKKSLSATTITLGFIAIVGMFSYWAIGSNEPKHGEVPTVAELLQARAATAATQPRPFTVDEIAGVFAKPDYVPPPKLFGRTNLSLLSEDELFGNNAELRAGAARERKEKASEDASNLASYRIAAERGDIQAQLNLERMYEAGSGVKQDRKASLFWQWKAAIQGHPASLYFVGHRLATGWTVQQDKQRATAWYIAAAQRGDADAQYELSGIYRRGDGAPQDYEQAMTWGLMAAEQGNSDAQYRVGAWYAKGRGVPQSKVEGHKWLNLSAADGNIKAAEARDSLEEKMTSGEIVEAQRRASAWSAGRK